MRSPTILAIGTLSVLAGGCAAEFDSKEVGDNSIAAPLEGVTFVEARSLKSLSSSGRVNAPRKDMRVPKLMTDLLRDETIVRFSPSCRFSLVHEHSQYEWSIGSHAGIHGNKADDLRRRLVARLERLGFGALPGTPDSVPRRQRGGERPFKYRKIEHGREWYVEFGNLVPWTGDRNPTIGIELAIIIRGTRKITTPKLSQVTAAMPTLAPPSHGKHPIPPAILQFVQHLPVTRVSLSGTGATWYSLMVVIPLSSLKNFKVQETIEAALKESGFREAKHKLPPNPNRPNARMLLHYVKRNPGDTSNCRIRLDQSPKDCRINLFVQP